jgi:hypothetical protein
MIIKDCAIHSHQEARFVNAGGKSGKDVCRKMILTAPSAA